jgi:hypothetical protein
MSERTLHFSFSFLCESSSCCGCHPFLVQISAGARAALGLSSLPLFRQRGVSLSALVQKKKPSPMLNPNPATGSGVPNATAEDDSVSIDFINNPLTAPLHSPPAPSGSGATGLEAGGRSGSSVFGTPNTMRPPHHSPGGSSGSGQRSAANSLDSFAMPTPPTPQSPVAHQSQRLHGQVGSLVLHFHVGSPHFGPEKVKPLTYFALETTVTALPGGLTPGANEVQNWAVTPQPTAVDRRYSEFVEMRRYLCYSFPWVVIPPLPPKSHLEGMKTFWADPDSLTQQRLSLDRFMREIGSLPMVLQFPIFSQFCVLPRDHPEFHSLIDGIRSRNSELDALRGIATSGMGEATKMVRSIYTSVSSWFTGSSSSTTSSGRHIPPNFDERMKVAMQESQLYRQWTAEVERLIEIKTAIETLIPPCSTYVETQKLLLLDVSETGVAFEGLASTLTETPLFASEGKAMMDGAVLCKSFLANHSTEQRRDEAGLVEALNHEVLWVDAAVEASKAMLYVIKTKLEQDLLNGRGGGQRARPAGEFQPSPVLDESTRIEQCNELHSLLFQELAAFNRHHQHRMRHIVTAKAKRALHYLEQDQKFLAEFPLVADMRAPSWLNECDMVTPDGKVGLPPSGESDTVWISSSESEQRLVEKEKALRYFLDPQQKR